VLVSALITFLLILGLFLTALTSSPKADKPFQE
jgi:hypothetical protein